MMFNRLLNKLNYRIIKRCSSSSSSAQFLAVKLSNRKIIRVCGIDSIIYLQSLITNDVRHLLPFENITKKTSLYAYMLNANGKVLCDLFLYRGKIISEGELLMEIDSCLAKAMKRLLWGHCIRRKISIEIGDDVSIWSLIPKSEEHELINEIVSDDISIVQDPRISQMGYRIITRLGSTFDDIKRYINVPIDQGTLGQFQKYRYQLGVHEGVDDIPSAFHHPFECNGDYLNAVSISKGLYVSEELTAKVYSGLSYLSSHGRKRIMPIEFQCDSQVLKRTALAPKTTIGNGNPEQYDPTNPSEGIGLLLNSSGKYGLAIFNTKFVDSYDNLFHRASGIKIKTWYPEWWPANKRRFLAQRGSLMEHYFPYL